MAHFPQDLFYDVSHHLNPQDLAAARITCQTFRTHVSSLVDFIRLNLDHESQHWDQELRAAIDAFPHVSQLFLHCPSGSAFQSHNLSASIVQLLSSRLQVLQLSTTDSSPFSWNLFEQLSGLYRLHTLKVNGIAGPAQYDPEDNPFEAFPNLTCLHVKSSWPRVPIPALLTLQGLQELKLSCDLWDDTEVSALSDLTNLTFLHLEGTQMSHQVQRTTLENLAQLPRLHTLRLGTLRAFQAYGVIDSASPTCSLTLAVDGDSAEALRVVSRCQPSNTHNLNLTIKGIIPETFFPAVAKLGNLQSLAISLRSYRRAAPNAAPLPPLGLSPVSTLLHLESFTMKSCFKGELQQVVSGEHAAQLLGSCTHLHTFAVDCLDAQTAGSLVQVLPNAPCLRTLALGCVSNSVTPPPVQEPRAADPEEGDHNINARSVAILPLETLPACVEDVHIDVSDSLVVHLGSAPQHGVVFPCLKHFTLTGWVADTSDVVCMASCMPHLQHLKLLQPDVKNKNASDALAAENMKGCVHIDELLNLPQLSLLHVEQANALLTHQGAQQLASSRLRHALVKCLVEQGHQLDTAVPSCFSK